MQKRKEYFMKKKRIITKLLAELDRLINGTQIGSYRGYRDYPFWSKTSSPSSIDLTGRLMYGTEHVRECREVSNESEYQFRSDFN